MPADDPAPAPGADPDAARAALADRLAGIGRAMDPAIGQAFRAVPRHLFLPGMPPASAYADQAFVIKYGDDGMPASSSSQPAMMAIMLEQLGLRPGHRVLEVGTGTGYNAALMAQITGDQHSVVTIDIDADLITRARANLTAAGADRVRAVCGDGGFGVPEYAPYDRIIVTAGAWSLAPQWLAQLAPGGRIVLPLSVRGLQLSVAFEQAGPGWSAISAFRCGFIRMAGRLAGPEAFVPLGPQPGWRVQSDDGRPLDTDGLYRALDSPPADMPAGLAVTGGEQLSDLDLWLTLTEPRLTRLTLVGSRRPSAVRPQLMPLGALADASPGRPPGRLAAAALVLPSGPADPADPAVTPRPPVTARRPATARRRGGVQEQLPVVLRGYGPAALALAEHLAGQARTWDRLGRPAAAQLSLTAWVPGSGPDTAGLPPGLAGRVILDRGDLRLAAGWAAG